MSKHTLGEQKQAIKQCIEMAVDNGYGGRNNQFGISKAALEGSLRSGLDRVQVVLEGERWKVNVDFTQHDFEAMLFSGEFSKALFGTKRKRKFGRDFENWQYHSMGILMTTDRMGYICGWIKHRKK